MTPCDPPLAPTAHPKTTSRTLGTEEGQEKDRRCAAHSKPGPHLSVCVPPPLSNLQRLPISYYSTLLLSLAFQLATPSYLIPTSLPARNLPTAVPRFLPVKPTKAPAPPRSLSEDPAGRAPTGTCQRLHTIRHLIAFDRHCPLMASRGTGLEGLSLL